MNLRLIILSLGLTACIGHSSARAGLSLGDLSSSLKGDSASNDITKIKKDAVEKKGLFTTLFNEKTGKLYLSIPEECLGKEYLLSSRIVATSDGQDYSAGEVHTRPMMIAFSTDTRNVFMHQVQNLNTVVGSDPIKPAFDRSNMNPVMKGFKIAARDGRNLVIDVTAFFGTNEKSISPMKDTGVLGKLLGSDSKLKGTFQSEASGIAEVKTFEKNIEIKSLLSYQITGALPKPYSVMVQRSLFALPENPMPMRLQDNRVGYFQTDKNIFSSNADRIAQKAYIERWRIEPKTEDLDKYFAGEMVEPQKQIVFYVDTAFPAKWRQTIREGIEVWNKAFEAAGFKNVVKAMDYPTDDDAFDPDNMQYNCFRYVATNTANAMGPSYVDPRTGEILAADVIWYHNIISLLHNWRFVQTGAVDKRVRKIKFDDDVMLESIKYAASHEVGHTLGLMHNMGASYAFPVEKLRDPQFTQKYGTTPSIMDYARNNYIAQPGDVERGVKLTPPEIGVYDIHAINWGYRIIKGISTPEEEKDTLCKWIEAKANDEMYEFGAQQLLGTIDPTDQTEDLGNDHIKASDYGISNMKILVENFDNWLMEKNERYDEIDNVYREILKQYGRYIKHVLPYIGGIRYKEVVQGEVGSKAKNYFTRYETKRAMDWLLNQMRTCDSWLIPARLVDKLQIDYDMNQKLRTQVVNGLMNATVLYRIQDGNRVNSSANYSLDGYLDDLTTAIFKMPSGGKLDDAEQQIQSAAITFMMNNSGLVQKPATTSASSSIYDETDESFCSFGKDSFARINMGTSSLSKQQMGIIMMGRLKAVLSKYKTYRTVATGLTRDFYDYEILQIERALANK